jgi:putative BNR repeat neuraminidase
VTPGRRTRLAGLTVAVLLSSAGLSHAARPIANGAWSYFGDPRAVNARGVTYAGWITSDGNVQVGTIGPGGVRKVTIAYLGRDDHGNPSLFFRRDGRLVALYAPHSRGIGRRRVAYRTTVRPYDISAWGPQHWIPGNTRLPGSRHNRGVAYPNPLRMGSRVWVFWRGGSWWPTLSYTQDWHHWKRPRNIISAERGQRPYLKVTGDGRNAYLAFTQAHPADRNTSIYFLQISESGVARTASGRKVGTIKRPISYRKADVVYRYQGSSGRAWVLDIALGYRRRPVVLYFRRNPYAGDEYRYARWTGRQWLDQPIARAGGFPLPPRTFYQTGATLDHENPSVVYLSRKRTPRERFEIETRSTLDQGATWHVFAKTAGSRYDNWRPISPRGSPGYQVLFFQGSYANYRAYETTLMAAD